CALPISRSWRTSLQELPTGREVLQLRGHQNVISDLGFSLDGRTLFTGSWDGSVRAWDVTARPKQADSRQFSTALGELDGGSGTAVCFSPDGRHLLSGFTDNTFSIWETLTLTESSRRPLPLTKFACAALAAGGKLVAFVAQDGNVVFWNADNNQTNWFARPTTEHSNRALFSRDGKRLAISGDRDLCVCDVSSKTRLHNFPSEVSTPFRSSFRATAKNSWLDVPAGLSRFGTSVVKPTTLRCGDTLKRGRVRCCRPTGGRWVRSARRSGSGT